MHIDDQPQAMPQGCEDAMMNHSAPIMRRRRRITVAMVAIVLPLLAACSGSPSSAGSRAGGSAGSTSAIAYSACMRSQGVPNFPDPVSGEGIPKGDAQQFGVSSTQYQAAQQACQSLISATGGSAQQQEQQCIVASDCSPAAVQRLLNVMREFSQCMRSHGVPNFPDPSTDSQGQPFFDASAHGISDGESHSPQFTAKLDECQRQTGNFPFSMG
jgi:hypothetical protein